MLEDLDFSNLKLPIEPKNLIYLYLAYKLINNIDKFDLSTFTQRQPVSGLSNLAHLRSPSSNNFVFLVIIIIGASFMFLNNILSKISVSSISVENMPALNKYGRKSANLLKRGCPMKKCPIFGNYDLESWKTQCPMSQCPVFQKKKCQNKEPQTQTEELDCQQSENRDEVEEPSVKAVSGGDFA